MRSVRKGFYPSVFLAVVGICLIYGEMPGRAQQTFVRRSGPRDWSHGQLVASGWGTDDPAVRRDWRTLRKHLQLEDAKGRRAPFAEWIGWLRQGGFFSGFPRPSETAQSTSDVKLDWALNTGGTGGVIGYPAKFSFDVSAANCSDVIYYTVNQNGSATSPNVIAITNAYAGCPGNPANTTPTVKFALQLPYGTGTSPTLSLDGTVLYVMESRPSANGGPILHGINVNNITSNPGTYNFNTGAWTSVHTLAAPTGTASSEQLFALTFSGTTNSLSSPYYEYDTNRIYFGDSAGRIHRIRNAKTTGATEDTGWPISCSAGAFQSPMAYNNQVIAGSTDGYIYRIDTTSGSPSCIRPARLGGGTGEGQAGGVTSPLIDVTNNKILVTTGDTNSGENKALGVYNLNFTAGQAAVAVVVLGAADGLQSQFPALDNDFWENNDGNVYAIGNGGQNNTLLIRIPYNGATVLSPAGYAAFRRNGTADSVATTPVVEFLTAAAVSNPDFIFCGGNGTGYMFMNRISSRFNGTATSPATMSGFFGTASGIGSGISVDTRTTSTTGTTATANIYFGTAGGSVQSTIVQLAQQF